MEEMRPRSLNIKSFYLLLKTGNVSLSNIGLDNGSAGHSEGPSVWLCPLNEETLYWRVCIFFFYSTQTRASRRDFERNFVWNVIKWTNDLLNGFQQILFQSSLCVIIIVLLVIWSFNYFKMMSLQALFVFLVP